VKPTRSDRKMLKRLIAPPAVTIVGASPNGHLTEHLLGNLANRSCRFTGPVHLVNPNYTRLFDRACVPSVDRIPGEPGLVYLHLPAEACLGALIGLRERPHGVVLFPDASHVAGGYEEKIAVWGREHGVGILGPQSNGLVSLPGRVHGLLIPVAETLIPGPVAILGQSGGVLGGMVKYLAQRGIGMYAALEFGTSCMLSPEELALWLLDMPEVRLVALYADGLASIDAFAEVLKVAQEMDKAVVFMVAGTSEAARRAVASHSGMAATPRRILEGVAAQFGAILARTLDELVWSIEALDAVAYERPSGRQIAVFSDSGGGGIAMADALAVQDMPLAGPSRVARELIGGRFGSVLNPFDFGSASMGHVREQAADVRSVATDPRYGVFAFASTIGMAAREHSVHVTQLDEFTATIEGLGKVPFVASPFPFERDGAVPRGKHAVLGLGSAESAVKMKALATWAKAATKAAPEAQAVELLADSTVDSAAVVTGREARSILGGMPVKWPAETSITKAADLDGAAFAYPAVVKTEAGVAHRAIAGGVLIGIDNEKDLRNAAVYMLDRFGGPVSVAEQVAHDREYFLGAYRQDGLSVLLLGAGGSQAESAAARLAPLTATQARDFAERTDPMCAESLTTLVLAFQKWFLAESWVEAVDMNPIVLRGDALVALDAKIHGRPPTAAGAGK
jgi:acetate---CoA ligase (ADP-forming)